MERHHEAVTKEPIQVIVTSFAAFAAWRKALADEGMPECRLTTLLGAS
ncbi:hypothetical protein [Acetobacter senegalensis]|nr:hypothetical protein [Acetobacter senegalensis]MDN7354134.1 hypothetical protein [Acetobacter senegalensis]